MKNLKKKKTRKLPHSIDEVYEHRNTLYITLCRILIGYTSYYVWRSKKHSDKTSAGKGWFILGINSSLGEQITYHLPISKWKETKFAVTHPFAINGTSTPQKTF